MNPTSRQLIKNLMAEDAFENLIHAGARFHQSGCMGCIGIGQAPATGKIRLRTMPRNFPGRSGTLDDQVYLCSPETAAAAALTGKITDPRDLKKLYDNETQDQRYEMAYTLSDRQLQVMLAGGVINYFRMKDQPELT